MTDQTRQTPEWAVPPARAAAYQREQEDLAHFKKMIFELFHDHNYGPETLIVVCSELAAETARRMLMPAPSKVLVLHEESVPPGTYGWNPCA